MLHTVCQPTWPQCKESADKHFINTLPPSPTASTKATEDSECCAICTPLGKDCPEKVELPSDLNEEDDQAKDND